MNRGEIRDQASFILNFNTGQVDADITTARFNKAIQYAYNTETNRLQQVGISRYFWRTVDISWPEGTETLALPNHITQSSIVKIRDITNNAYPEGLMWMPNWRTASVWFWPQSGGPPDTKTYRITYVARPEVLLADTSVPELIAPQFHELIVWSTVNFLRTVADEAPPPAFIQELERWRNMTLMFYSYLNPHEEPLTIGKDIFRSDISSSKYGNGDFTSGTPIPY